MKNSTTLAVLTAASLTFGFMGPSKAQQAPKSKETPRVGQKAPNNSAAPSIPQADIGAAPVNAPALPDWPSRCSSVSREAPLECAIEQRAVLARTGQLVVLVTIRVPSDTRKPVAMIQLPLGLYMPNGIKLQVDERKVADLQVQTCEAQGCYTGTPIGPDLLTDLKSGKQLIISFQNLNKEAISVQMPLVDFAAAYEKIK